MRLTVLIVTALLYVIEITKADTAHSRSQRSILEFGTLIECATGGSFTDYNSYGCYCGLGGSGTPVDATDRCCKQHDLCYSALKRSGKCPKKDKLLSVLGVEVPAIYAQTYEFAVKNCAQPTRVTMSCKRPNQYSFWRRVVMGDTLNCAYSLCECDRKTAECFARNRNTYNKRFLDSSQMFNKRRCGPKVESPSVPRVPSAP